MTPNIQCVTDWCNSSKNTVIFKYFKYDAVAVKMEIIHCLHKKKN